MARDLFQHDGSRGIRGNHLDSGIRLTVAFRTDDFDEQMLFVGEIAVERGFAHAACTGDFIDRGRFIAMHEEDIARAYQDLIIFSSSSNTIRHIGCERSCFTHTLNVTM